MFDCILFFGTAGRAIGASAPNRSLLPPPRVRGGKQQSIILYMNVTFSLSVKCAVCGVHTWRLQNSAKRKKEEEKLPLAR
jgi:hypothetical protein